MADTEASGPRPKWGVQVNLPASSPIFSKKIQRAEGDGTGSPSTGTKVVLTVVPGRKTRWVDDGSIKALDGSKDYIYRYRFIRPGAQDGSWSNWTDEKSPSDLRGQVGQVDTITSGSEGGVTVKPTTSDPGEGSSSEPEDTIIAVYSSS